MRRIAVLLSILMISHLVSASPEITVNLNLERKLSDFDIGIKGGEISPDGETVLIYGEDGYAHLLSASNADDEATDIRLEKEPESALNDATWHPGGKSALIVGDDGTILRFNSTNYALGEAEGSLAMAGIDINSIHFTAGSSVAYLGTDSARFGDITQILSHF